MTHDEIIARAMEVHSWRDQKETEWLANRMDQEGIPFCAECGDWHHPTEEHSFTEYESEN